MCEKSAIKSERHISQHSAVQHSTTQQQSKSVFHPPISSILNATVFDHGPSGCIDTLLSA